MFLATTRTKAVPKSTHFLPLPPEIANQNEKQKNNYKWYLRENKQKKTENSNPNPNIIPPKKPEACEKIERPPQMQMTVPENKTSKNRTVKNIPKKKRTR